MSRGGGRKGVASAANAIGARLTGIRYVGGWFTNYTGFEAKYIDFAMQATPDARLFFGYLCKGAPT
jgi:ribosomal protein S2